jgi:1,4-dihydroxy-2-naphthoate octaprenyltransferase
MPGVDAQPAGSPAPSRREIWVRLLLYPGHTLPTAAAPLLIAVGLALRDHVFAALPAALAFLGSWLVHVAGVFTDNHELLRRHPDVPEHPELLEALRRRTLSLRGLQAAILTCLIGAALAGAYLYTIGGSLVLVIGLVGVAGSLSYAGGPLAYARTGLAEPLFLLMFSVVAVPGAYYIQAAAARGAPPSWSEALGLLPWDAFLAGLPVAALVTNVLIIDDIRDRSFDAVKGWRTGAVRFGIGASRLRYLGFSVLAYGAPFGFWLAPGGSPWVLLPLLSLPEAWMTARVVCTRQQADELLAMTPRASRLALIFAALQAAGVALSGS